jgi:hypothetical protein|tara:strand:- start:2883 stop:3074 length:192 start_codon:yes stop_codon:yes gene_type:complete
MTTPVLTKKVYEYLADTLMPLLNNPTSINKLADELENTNPKFNRQKFVDRSVIAWEKYNDIDG